jgi:hypothetical protein
MITDTPAETKNSRLASHLVRAPISRSGGHGSHEFDSLWELGALTKANRSMGLGLSTKATRVQRFR